MHLVLVALSDDFFFFFAGFLLASEIYVFIPGFLLQGFEIFFPSAEQSDFLLWWLSFIQFWWSYPVFRPDRVSRDRVSPWLCFVLTRPSSFAREWFKMRWVPNLVIEIIVSVHVEQIKDSIHWICSQFQELDQVTANSDGFRATSSPETGGPPVELSPTNSQPTSPTNSNPATPETGGAPVDLSLQPSSPRNSNPAIQVDIHCHRSPAEILNTSSSASEEGSSVVRKIFASMSDLLDFHQTPRQLVWWLTQIVFLLFVFQSGEVNFEPVARNIGDLQRPHWSPTILHTTAKQLIGLQVAEVSVCFMPLFNFNVNFRLSYFSPLSNWCWRQKNCELHSKNFIQFKFSNLTKKVEILSTKNRMTKN